MPADDLPDALNALRANMAGLQGLDADARERAQALAARIEMHLENPDTAALTDGFADQVRAELTRYEVTHPRLTEVLQRVLTALANMGI